MTINANISKEVKELNKQLYPTGRAWGFVHGSEQVDTQIVSFVDGLGNPFVDGFGNPFVSSYGSEASPSKRLVNAYLKSYERLYESIYKILSSTLADNEEFDVNDASNWERVYGLTNNNLTLDVRKENILRKQSYPNGVAERGNYLFIQDQLQAAGFDVYVHENRFPDGSGGWITFNPNASNYGDFTYGGANYGSGASFSYTKVANYIDEDLDSSFDLGTDINLRATCFIGGEIFGDSANVDSARKDEFRHMILRLKPAQIAGLLIINYV